MVAFWGCCCHCLCSLFVPANLLISVNRFLCHLEIHQIPLFLVMDYREQNSGRIWSKTPPHHLGVADREREMELNSRKSDLDQPGMWMDLVILFFFLLWRWKLHRSVLTPTPPPVFLILFLSGWLGKSVTQETAATDWQCRAVERAFHIATYFGQEHLNLDS